MENSETRFKKREQPDIRLDITPLIDVVFILLIFFMISTTFITVPGIKVKLPESISEEITREKREVVVGITTDQKIFLEQKEITLKDLEDRLKKVAKKDQKTMVIIQADEEVVHGRVVEVMDIAKFAGLNRLAIATRPKEKVK